MNPSVLIFVALAVAWLAYLIPKALEHTEAAERTRAVVDFSHRLRVLGRREPVGAVPQSEQSKQSKQPKPAEQAPVSTRNPAEQAPVSPLGTAEQPRVSAPAAPRGQRAGDYLDRSAYNRAARRRRTVLTSLVIVLFVCVVLAVFAIVPKLLVAGPVLLIAAWLVACRLMVRRERPAVRRAPAAGPADDGEQTGSVTLNPPAIGIEEDGHPEQAVTAQPAPGDWEPVQVPLPTYVAKPAARREVRTIDLDGTGVWSSGRNDSDSALARSADAARSTEPTQQVRRKTS